MVYIYYLCICINMYLDNFSVDCDEVKLSLYLKPLFDGYFTV